MDVDKAPEMLSESDARTISQALRSARMTDMPLSSYPGPLPLSMEAAYLVQSLSTDAWFDDVSGWKVGGVPPHLQKTYGATRLAGPIFSRTVRRAPQQGVLDVPAFKGFVAVEAEWVFELGDCSGVNGAELSADDVAALVRAAFMGVEIASSPIIDINGYGPAVVASDFGNNHGLVIGASLKDWSSAALSEIQASVEVEGASIGAKRAAPGLDGPLGAVKFLIEHLTKQGASDLSGLYVSSGAITGVHEVQIGNLSTIRFDGLGEISLRVVPIAN